MVGRVRKGRFEDIQVPIESRNRVSKDPPRLFVTIPSQARFKGSFPLMRLLMRQSPASSGHVSYSPRLHLFVHDLKFLLEIDAKEFVQEGIQQSAALPSH